MFNIRPACATSVLLVLALVLACVSFPSGARAQLAMPLAAAGFEMNAFASQQNVPEFDVNAIEGPTAMAFDSRGRLFVATYTGEILIMLDKNEDGVVDEIKRFASGVPIPLGLEFRDNGDLYATSNIFGGAGRILKFRDTNGDDVADETTVIVDGLPSEGEHQTDRLKFGPDGLLYISQGSSTDNGIPKPGHPDERPLNAAILRVDVDNPSTVTVFATGLRNSFGIAFHPDNGALFATDGGSGEICVGRNCPPDTAPHDEVNWVVQGGNYGFPFCEDTPSPDNPNCAGVRAPIQQFIPHVTPTSLAFYTGPQAGEFKNQLLVTLFKRLHEDGCDLRRLKLEGDPATGFQVVDNQFIARFLSIDWFDGPVETAIDPISGDIYVARYDTVTHPISTEHHHIIYRIHRVGSDALTFIGPVKPSAVKAGAPGLTISLFGRRVKPGAVIFDVSDGVPLATRPGPNAFQLLADLPASLLATARTITLEVRHPDGSKSNQQTFSVTNGVPPPPDGTPHLDSLFVYKKKRKRVVNPLTVGATTKKLRLVVDGAGFDSGAQLLVNSVALQLDSSSATELVGRVTDGMVTAVGELTVQVKNSTGKVSNALKLLVSP